MRFHWNVTKETIFAIFDFLFFSFLLFYLQDRCETWSFCLNYFLTIILFANLFVFDVNYTVWTFTCFLSKNLLLIFKQFAHFSFYSITFGNITRIQNEWMYSLIKPCLSVCKIQALGYYFMFFRIHYFLIYFIFCFFDCEISFLILLICFASFCHFLLSNPRML